ncbi:hypothetical protein V4D00_17460 [Ralstonia solanacearum]|uniref:hypothetical protein n=1 Tax=Ralstonia solanacearum TaxID=305 RepID=UPI002F959826
MTDELIEASVWLRSEGNHSPLALEVRRRFPGATVFLIASLAEQGEDIHWLLVGPDKVARVEIRREPPGADEAPPVEMIELQSYRANVRSKSAKRMLDAAVDLLNSHRELRGPNGIDLP